MERYDIAIIGTGPAGLEAAITARIRNKKIILFGNKNLSLKVEKAHTIQNYLGLPEVSGEEMQKAFQRHLEQMQIKITEDKVNAVYAMGKYFAIQGHQAMYEADTVILACVVIATGAEPRELGVAMEKELVGRGVSYCATCDGALYRGRRTVVIGYSRDEEKEADFLSELADEVIYIPMYQEFSPWNNKVKVLQNVTPVGMEKENDHLVLKLQEQSIPTDGIFILRDQVAPSQLVPGLQIENNQVIVDRGCRTNIAGLFACGDITGAPYQYIKAAGEGNVAALSAVNYLADQKQVQ